MGTTDHRTEIIELLYRGDIKVAAQKLLSLSNAVMKRVVDPEAPAAAELKTRSDRVAKVALQVHELGRSRPQTVEKIRRHNDIRIRLASCEQEFCQLFEWFVDRFRKIHEITDYFNSRDEVQQLGNQARYRRLTTDRSPEYLRDYLVDDIKAQAEFVRTLSDTQSFFSDLSRIMPGQLAAFVAIRMEFDEGFTVRFERMGRLKAEATTLDEELRRENFRPAVELQSLIAAINQNLQDL